MSPYTEIRERIENLRQSFQPETNYEDAEGFWASAWALATWKNVFKSGGKIPLINANIYFILENVLGGRTDEQFEAIDEKLATDGGIEVLLQGIEDYLDNGFSYFFGNDEDLASDDLLSLFGESKYATEAIIRAYSKKQNLNGFFVSKNSREKGAVEILDTQIAQAVAANPADYVIPRDNFPLPNDGIIKLREKIGGAVNNGTLDRTLGLPFANADTISENYSLDNADVYIAELVQAIINDPDRTGINININTSDAHLFTMSTVDEEGAKKDGSFEAQNNLPGLYVKIDQDYPNTGRLIDRSKIRTLFTKTRPPKTGILDFDNRPHTGIKNIDQNVVENFPSSVYKDNPDILDVFRSDESLKDLPISGYTFQYYTKFADTTWLEGILNAFKGTTVGTTQEYVSTQLKSKYVDFILAVYEDYKKDADLDATIGQHFEKQFSEDFAKSIYTVTIAIDKEIARRVEIFNQIADAVTFLDESKVQLSLEDLKQIERAGAEAFATSQIEAGQQKLTDGDIEDRQQFYKQCALLMNISTLAPKFRSLACDRQFTQTPDGPDPSKPFGGRFWMAHAGNNEGLITNLVSAEDSSYMFEIPTHILTQLRPKFRLFKVMNDQEGSLFETEFIFPTHTDLSRKKNFKKNQGATQEPGSVQSFLEADFDKGDGCGLKSFTVDFNGTSPAEARNDIQGAMNLYFQSFADFTRKRIDPKGNEFRFVDLIIQPIPDETTGAVAGTKIVSLRQYEPSFYRIRVDVGYNVPKRSDIQGISENEYKKLKIAIETMNKSYFLCMIDHSFNIKNDGTVDISFTYRAYLETALKSVRFDALTTPELAEKRMDNANKLFDTANANKCTQRELRELQVSLASEEKTILMQSLRSILRRLNKRNKIFNVDINKNDRNFFLKRGYFTSCRLNNQATLEADPDDPTGNDLGVALATHFLSDDPEKNFNRDADDVNIQFFFFGDLLHTILDALYDPKTKKTAVGLENTKIVLGGFDFDPYQEKNPDIVKSFNIAHIPISVDFFSEWFRDNVLNQKSTRRTFPILNFIRSLSNYLVSNALLETCVNRQVEQKLMFQTAQITAVDTEQDPLGKLVSLPKRGSVMFSSVRTDYWRNKAALPLKGDPLIGAQGGTSDTDAEYKSHSIKNFYHYIVLNANGSALTYVGSGNYAEDIKAGRFHVQIGSNRGLVKTVQFAKTDMQYVREARFLRQGIDGLLQLSSVYTANIDMFGNTLFYPGMELWIDPYGVGGTHIGRPQQGGDNRSIANILGLGGYHTITGVSTTITPNSFTTKIKSQHYYSGDGESPDKSSAKVAKKKTNNDLLIEQGINEADQTEQDKKFCTATILSTQNFSPDNVQEPEEREPEIDEEPQTTTGTQQSNQSTPPPAAPTGEEIIAAWSAKVDSQGNSMYVVPGVGLKSGTFRLVPGIRGKNVYFSYEDDDGIDSGRVLVKDLPPGTK